MPGVSFFFFLLLLSSCMVGPSYQKPEAVISERWASADENTSSEPLQQWWQALQDSLLVEYIEKASACNYDIKMAESRICYARAIRKMATSRYYPKIDSEVDYLRSHIGDNAVSPSFFSLPQQAFFRFADVELYSIGFDAFWEIDLFGKIKQQVQGATAQISAAIEERNDLMVTLFGDVAKNYIAIRSEQMQILLLQRRLSFLSDQLQIAKERSKAGVFSEVEITSLQTELEALSRQLPDRKSEEYAAIYRLGVLTGQMPEAVLLDFESIQSLPQPPETIALGLRSALLRRRPDVRRAEREFAAAVADVGVATASFFPDVALGTNVFLRSIKPEKLFEAKSFSWMIDQNILTPLFHAGELKANLAANKALAQQAFFQYQKTVLIALQEAESALAAYLSGQMAYRNAWEAFSSSKKTLLLMENRYKVGMIGRFEYLDASLKHAEIESLFVQSQSEALLAAISLYKALGGACI